MVRKSMLLLLAAGFFWSCTEENVLELEPYNQTSESASFSTPDLVDLSVTGMYNAAQRGSYADGSGRGYPFGAAVIQQNDTRGEDAVNTQAFYQLTYTATYDPTTANNVYYWSDTYRLINRANIVMEGIAEAQENGVITPEAAADYIAQAKFLRALSHFELVLHFARPYHHTADASHPGIPYRELAFNTQENIEAGLQQGRNSVAEVYSKVLDDLNAAENGLFSKSERSGTSQITRATKEAAIALKTRVYLHMRDWPNVLTEAQKITGTYSLTDTPFGPFDNGYGNSESIFSMENSANNNPGVNAALASQYKRRVLVAISPIIWNDDRWLEDDLRRDDSDAGLIIDQAGVKYTHKYKDDVTYTDPTPIIRYAEVVLNMAEAHARQDNLSLAIDALNEVRDRSLADPASQSYTSADLPSKQAVLEAIIFERRVEFLLEGNRWHDIHRLQGDDFVPIDGIPAKYPNTTPNAADYEIGTPYDASNGVNPVPYDDYRFVWPIPQQEINTNPVLAGEQNPGW